MRTTGGNMKRLYDFYCLGSILFLIYCSGNQFALSNYSLSVSLFLAFELVFSVLFMGSRLVLPRRTLWFFLVSAVMYFLGMVMNSFGDLPSYVAILMQLVCVTFISTMISAEDFQERYLRIILILAFISLIFYFLSIFMPGIAYYFPRSSRSDLNLRYYNAYVYVFWEETGWGYTLFSKRNAGIFWEPGVYQAFLNYALYLVLSREHTKHVVRDSLILIVTILTTFSVTGYMVLLLLIVSFLFRRNRRGIALLISFVGVGLTVAYGFSIPSVLNKLRSISYVADRISLTQIPVLLSDYRSYMFGVTFSGRSGTIWNAIIDSCFVFGIPYVILLITLYIKSCRKRKQGMLLFICLMMFFSSEPLIWRPFFLLIPYYGMSSDYGGERVASGVMLA